VQPGQFAKAIHYDYLFHMYTGRIVMEQKNECISSPISSAQMKQKGRISRIKTPNYHAMYDANPHRFTMHDDAFAQ
jgi:hypothetical protein